MAVSWFQLQVEILDLVADKFVAALIQAHPADVLYPHLLPIQFARVVFEILLHLRQKLLNVDLMRLDVDLAAVSERETYFRVLPCRKCGRAVEASPVVEDLVNALLLPLLVPFAVLLDAPLPEFYGPVILTPVLECLGKLMHRFFCIALLVISNFLIDGYETGIGGHLETLNTCCKLRNGFVLFQRVYVVGSALIVIGILFPVASKEAV